jgi:uncharacterized protein (TIGR00730 family)
MENKLRRIAVYCGSSDQIDQKYLDSAYDLGQLLAINGISLVYGGGKTGMMGRVADGVMSQNGEVIGITIERFTIPHFLPEGITKLEVKKTMHQRKARMAELADGFIALPGGFGTMDEFFDTLTLAQIGIHKKPIGVLNVDGFYNALKDLFSSFKDNGFTYDFHDSLYFIENDSKLLLNKMQSYVPSGQLHEWIERTDI